MERVAAATARGRGWGEGRHFPIVLGCAVVVSFIDAASNLTPLGGYFNTVLQNWCLAGMVVGGAMLADFDSYFERHACTALLAGVIAFIGCFSGCFMLQGDAQQWLPLCYLVLGVAMVVVKFIAVALVARFRSVPLLAPCIAWSQVAKIYLVWLFGAIDSSFQWIYLGSIAAALLGGAICVARATDFPEKNSPKMTSRYEASMGYLVTQALFIVAILATLRVLKLPDVQVGAAYLYGGPSLLLFLFLPLVACRLFREENEESAGMGLRSALLVMLAGLLVMVLKGSGTSLLSTEGMGVLALWLEGFGHVAFWTSVALLGWRMRGKVLRFSGLFIAIWAVFVLLWRIVFGEMGEVATLIIAGIVYLYMVFATRMFPSLFRKPLAKRTLVDDEHLLSLACRHGLSEREEEVFLLLAQGRSRRFICEELYISDGTAKSYISRIYKKFKVSSKQELLAAVFDGDSDSSR